MKHKVWSMISNIKNGLLSNKKYIRQIKHTNCESVLDILWDEGFIVGYKTCSLNCNFIVIFLKYQIESPSIKSVKSISKSSFKIYYSTKQLWKLNLKQSLIILSTNKGVFSLDKCKKLNLGGEPILIIS